MEQMQQAGDSPYRDHERLALATAWCARSGTCVLGRRWAWESSRRGVPVVPAWLARVEAGWPRDPFGRPAGRGFRQSPCSSWGGCEGTFGGHEFRRRAPGGDCGSFTPRRPFPKEERDLHHRADERNREGWSLPGGFGPVNPGPEVSVRI